MSKNILLFGLQRSGTNFLEQLLIKNFKIHILNDYHNRKSPLQKHFRIYDQKDIIPEYQYKNDLRLKSFEQFLKVTQLDNKLDCVLIISKNPYNWLISYKEWAVKCNWPAVNHNYLEEYNLFYRKWIEFSKEDERIQFVKYENLLLDTKKELKKLKKRFDFQYKLLRQIYGLEIKLKKVPQTTNFTKVRRNFYERNLFLDELKKEGVDEINSMLDLKVISHLNYSIQKVT